MKRILALLFALSLLLCACKAKEPEYPPIPKDTEATTAPTEANTEPTEATEPTDPAVIRNPLNGTRLETPYTGRPTAVVLSNDSDAMPQHGLSQADFVFEAVVEGGITRLLVVFSDIGSVEGKIGPVRSARSFFNSVSRSFNAPIVHCGGSKWGINGFIDENTQLKDWAHINEQNNASYFYRDPDRSGYDSWLTLFTTGEKLQKGMTDKGYVSETPPDYGFQFDENVVLEGDTANKIVVNFKGSKTTTMTYSAETGLYSAQQHKQDHIDGNTKKALTYKNVICLYTEHRGVQGDTYVHSFYTLIGEGTGHFATGGKIIPIKWSRADVNAPFSFTLEDGTPITLGVGSTYVGICSDTVSADYE